MTTSPLLTLLGSLLLAATAASGAHAQTPVWPEGPLADGTGEVARAAPPVQQAQPRSVTLDLVRVTRVEALRAVRDTSGLRLSWSPDADGLGDVVDVHLEGVPAFDAVRAVLEGSRLELHVTPSGFAVVRPRPRPPPRSR